MATAPTHPPAAADGPKSAQDLPPEDRDPKGLKVVPSLRSEREQIRDEALARAARLDRSRPLSRQGIEACARAILADLGLAERHCGWTMVAVATAFWQPQVEGIPPSRRLLLLPHCLRNSQTCPAEYNELGLMCRDCGACELSELRATAQRQGYQVLIAEGSPAVIEIILRGGADAILGAACLNSLEKVFDKILAAGIPCMAVPLLASTCRDTSIDVDWVRGMIDTPYRPGGVLVPTYVHLLRAAMRLFNAEELERLLPRARSGPGAADGNGQGLAGLEPVAATEAIAHDFLRRGGKHLRPFITLAAYDAMTGGGGGNGRDGDPSFAEYPEAVQRIALAMEVFHKASLVHDDIEDDDPLRYGLPAVHRTYGVPMAINVGDYLIGLGYRLVAGERRHVSGEAVADVLARLAEAHTRLCEGQGAELAWREAPDKRIGPVEALRIYALKTSPAFEAALYAGLRLAGPVETLVELAARFARHLGVAFQVLNDLDDWRVQPDQRAAGMDALAGRPTVLWAFALEALGADDRQRLARLVSGPAGDPAALLQEVRALYDRAGVFEKASGLIAKHRRRAHEVADAVPHVRLAHLFHYLADTILQG